jgi:hypothetical protein
MLHGNQNDTQIISICYVSRSSLEGSEALEAVSDIVIFASSNNAQLRVTGGLLYTGVHFAQVLEGPQKHVEELLSKIERDGRHTAVTVVDRRPIKRRKFPSWAMAYSGPSPFLDRHIKPLLSPFVTGAQREELINSLQGKLLGFITAKSADGDLQPTPTLHLVGDIQPIKASLRKKGSSPLM